MSTNLTISLLVGLIKEKKKLNMFTLLNLFKPLTKCLAKMIMDFSNRGTGLLHHPHSRHSSNFVPRQTTVNSLDAYFCLWLREPYICSARKQAWMWTDRSTVHLRWVQAQWTQRWFCIELMYGFLVSSHLTVVTGLALNGLRSDSIPWIFS